MQRAIGFRYAVHPAVELRENRLLNQQCEMAGKIAKSTSPMSLSQGLIT
jgi:hypothetical protein